MATETKPIELTFNGQPIPLADAKTKLAEIYGEKRVTEILDGLVSGKYGCASVAGGYFVLVKPPSPPS